MKRLYFILILCIFISCGNDEQIALELGLVSREDSNCHEQSVIEYAESIYQLFNTDSRAEMNIVQSIIPFVKYNNVSRSDNLCDTLLYIVNYKDSCGFAVVSAKNTDERLLGYVDSGTYSPDETKNYFNIFINDAALWVEENAVESAETNFLEPILKTKFVTEYVTKSEVAPKVEVKWGRSQWEGKFCPNGDPGAATICIAQIMSYYEPGVYLNLDPNSTLKTKLDWTSVKNHDPWLHYDFDGPKEQVILNPCSASDKSHNDLAYLCYDIALTSCAKFYSEGTEIEPYALIDALCWYDHNLDWSGQYYRREDSEKYEGSDFLRNDDAKIIIRDGLMAFATTSNSKNFYYCGM